MSFLGSAGGARRVGLTLLRHRLISATAGTAAVVIVAGCAFAAASGHGSSQEKLVNAGNTQPATKSSAAASAPSESPAPAEPLRLLSVSPRGGSGAANGGAPITLTFSSALASGTPLPTLSPKVAGSWKVSGATATFTPASGYLPDTKVTLSVPGSIAAATAADGTLGQASTVSFTTGDYSTLRLQQLLAQLGYLPLTWTPAASGSGAAIPSGAAAANGGTADSTDSTDSTDSASMNQEVSAAYDPPAGTLTFQSGYPSALTKQWKTGKDNILDTGAIRAFENDHGLTMDGDAGPQVWADLLAAAAKDKTNPNGYTYALASQDSPDESLKVWHNGKVILNSPANTGIAAANTQDGTFPVYERLQFQIMKGKNPDGTKYADPVYWISYFNGGDAVHYFERPGYGYYQSLGCVELPLAAAKYIWSYLTYGTLVTVTGPVA